MLKNEQISANTWFQKQVPFESNQVMSINVSIYNTDTKQTKPLNHTNSNSTGQIYVEDAKLTIYYPTWGWIWGYIDYISL